MKDDIAYVFNGKQFISVRKNEMLNQLVDMHIDEINKSLEKNRDKLNNLLIQRLEKFLNMLNDDDTKFTDVTQRVYPNYSPERHIRPRGYKAYKLMKLNL